MAGVALTTPAKIRRAYTGNRRSPCEPTPRRSPNTRHSATVSASFRGTPARSRTSLANANKESTAKRECEEESCVPESAELGFTLPMPSPAEEDYEERGYRWWFHRGPAGR